MNKLLILLLILLIIFPSTYAVSVTYTYLDSGGSSLNGVGAVVYEISSKNKVGSTYTTTGNILEINYPSDVSNYYTYHFKEGYVSYQKTKNGDYDINLYKATNCGANSIIEVPSSGTVNQDITINANLNKIVADLFGSFLVGGYPLFVPSELIDYYSAETEVKLLVDNVEVEKKTVKIANEYLTVPFTWRPSQAKIYTIKITTEVKDNQCQSFTGLQESTTKSITIASAQQPSCTDECPTLNEKICNQTNTKILQTCKEGADGCHYWQNTDCSINNQVCSNANCVTPSATCTENWVCGYPYYNSANQWSVCINNIQSKVCTDTNNCGTTNNKPTLTQSCSTTQDTTEPQGCVSEDVCSSWSDCIEGKKTRQCANSCAVEEKTESQPCDQETVEAEKRLAPQADINQAIGNVTANFFNILANKLEEILQTSKYSLIILFILVASIIVSIVYYIETHREKILKPKQKIKEGKKPVKINDLMLSVIDSLDADEREICYALAENEGISQDEIRNKVNLTKTKLEIALTKLERRQVIKPREGENPKLYFNDWLK